MFATPFRRVFSEFTLSVFLLVAINGQAAAESAATGQSQAGEADVVYKNGFVYTADGPRSRAQAFALRDGKFLKVGSNDDMKAVTGKDTRVIDLKGKMVMPGLIDTHTAFRSSCAGPATSSPARSPTRSCHTSTGYRPCSPLSVTPTSRRNCSRATRRTAGPTRTIWMATTFCPF